MMFTKKYLLALMGVLASCAGTPKGSPELMTKIEMDQKRELFSEPLVNQGRPLFVEAATYPQLLPNGDIWTGGVILINVGREHLDIESAVTKYREVQKP